MSVRKSRRREPERTPEGLGRQDRDVVVPETRFDKPVVGFKDNFAALTSFDPEGPRFGLDLSNKFRWVFNTIELAPYSDGLEVDLSDYQPETDPKTAASDVVLDISKLAEKRNFHAILENGDAIKCFFKNEYNTFVAFRFDTSYKQMKIGIGVSSASAEEAIELASHYYRANLETLPQLALSLTIEFNVPASMSKDAAVFLRSTIKHELRRYLEERLPVPQEKYDAKNGDVVTFIQEKWTQWLECHALSMPVLMRHDEAAYAALNRWLKKGNALPSSVSIPSKRELLMEEINDPNRVREARRIGRAAERLMARDP